MSEGRARSDQAVRFLLAGGLAAAINWLVRFPIEIWVPFEAAVALAQIVGWTAGFFLYRTFVFPPADLPLVVQIGRFIAVNLASGLFVLAAAILAMHLLVFIHMGVSAAQALAHGGAIGLGAVLNFFGHARITFAEKQASP